MVMHALFSTDRPRRPTPKWLARLGMALRRFRHWLRGFQWWAVWALVFALTALVLAVFGEDYRRVMAASGAAITLAILSTKESA